MKKMIERVIPAVQVKTDPIRCPRCDGRNLTLEGVVTRGFEEITLGDNPVVQKFAEELERETHSIECRDCQIRFLIMTADEYSLAQQNMQLHEALLQYSPNYIQATNRLPC